MIIIIYDIMTCQAKVQYGKVQYGMLHYITLRLV